MIKKARVWLAATAMAALVATSFGTVRPVNAAHEYICGKYGYSFTIPSGWKMVKADTLHCAVKASDILSQSSPLFSSAAGRAFLQIDVIGNKSYAAAQWIKDYAGLLGAAPSSIKVSSTTIHGRKFSAMAGPVSLKSSSGATTHLFLALAGIQYKGKMYGFLGGVSLDNNKGANSEAVQMHSAFDSLILR